MRVGIIILPDQRWSTARRRWQLAEEYGFDYAWTYDHLGWRDLVDGPWFDAMTTLTAAALTTSRIRLRPAPAPAGFPPAPRARGPGELPPSRALRARDHGARRRVLRAAHARDRGGRAGAVVRRPGA